MDHSSWCNHFFFGREEEGVKGRDTCITVPAPGLTTLLIQKQTEAWLCATDPDMRRGRHDGCSAAPAGGPAATRGGGNPLPTDGEQDD